MSSASSSAHFRSNRSSLDAVAAFSGVGSDGVPWLGMLSLGSRVIGDLPVGRRLPSVVIEGGGAPVLTRRAAASTEPLVPHRAWECSALAPTASVTQHVAYSQPRGNANAATAYSHARRIPDTVVASPRQRGNAASARGLRNGVRDRGGAATRR